MPSAAGEKQNPVLITLDVHRSDDVSSLVIRAADELKRLDIPATFFVPIAILEDYQDIISKILDNGHQIASHGLFHNNRKPHNGFPPERYDLLDESTQRRFIEEAIRRAQHLLGREITCFRSPCFGLSAATARLLEEYGYQADFSVNSQRLDFLSSTPFSFNNLLAPRLPYHPNASNPFRRGDLNIWEIPVSACVVPYAVMTLATFGFNLTKMFFQLLSRETMVTSKPIVYMCHPEDFSTKESSFALHIKDLRFKDFLLLPGEGIRARQALRINDPSKIRKLSLRLLEYMKSFKSTRFLTADQYIREYLA